MITTERDEVEHFIARLLGRVGTPRSTAKCVAHYLVLADVRGHRSHGVRMARAYLGLVEGDRRAMSSISTIDPRATPRVEDETDTTAVIDGQRAFGPVVGELAVDTGVEKAATAGMCAVGVRNATHLGRIGGWAERATAAELLFVGLVNSQHAGVVAAPGSAHRRFSTNPLAIGIPTFGATDFPLLLDMATSQVSFGKVRERLARGESLPAEWTTTAAGQPITDPAEFLDGAGALLPLGGRSSGYKGFGLCLMAEVLAAVLGRGMTVGREGADGGNCAAFLFLDPTRFLPPSEISSRVTTLREYLSATDFVADLTPGDAASGDTALLPGQAEHLSTRAAAREGVGIEPTDARALYQLAVEYDIEDEAPAAFQRA